MASIFAYGTLLDPENLKAITGRAFDTQDAALDGYEKITDGYDYPIITKKDGGKVLGKLLLEVDDASLKLLDDYEGQDYVRIGVTVFCCGQNMQVFVYTAKPLKRDDLKPG
jgi:gamma-glutamylcyclotransferase (GGCT)/AIG2-like uncharacterized protein YtfP